MDFRKLILNTNAYNLFIKDKLNGTLSHAYLIVCEDQEYLENYLKVFANIIMSETYPYDDNSRTAKLIEKKNHPDVHFYPTDKSINKDDINDILHKIGFKAVEGGNKVFVLNNAQEIQTLNQNKLLKTLEETPDRMYFILGATTTNYFLPTILSRVRKLEIFPFSEGEMYNLLESQYEDKERLKRAIKYSSGKLGEVDKKYTKTGSEIEESCFNVLLNMESSKEIYKFAKVCDKNSVEDFLTAMLTIVAEAIDYQRRGGEVIENISKVSEKYSIGALIYISDKIKEYNKTSFFNGNPNGILNGLFFAILEGRYKWQK